MKRHLYLFSSGKLSRKDNTLMFEKEDGKKVHLPVEQTDSIYVFGELDINKRILEFLTQNQIMIHFFNRYEYYAGTYYPREHLNSGHVILEQCLFYTNQEKRLELAKKIISGAMKNMKDVMKYYKNRGKELENHLETAEEFEKKLNDTESINEIMAIEGNYRENYYQSFEKIVSGKGFEFKNRSKKPPKNEMNALISFGNTLMYTSCLNEIYKTHLDPRIGILHSTNFRNFSLNLDIAEIFKPIIVDRLIFSLINKNQIKTEHFGKHLEGIYLNEKGKELFVSSFDEKMKSTVKNEQLKRNVSNRYLIRLEAYKIQKHITGEKEYLAYRRM